MPEPLVSVVVCTYDRPDRLARLLASLRAQTLPRKRFEVVVVDNGSGPATERVLAQERASGAGSVELALVTVRHERPLGPAAGRNAGWRLARAPLVAFTDDDCVAEPSWLSSALAVAAAHPGAVIQGRTRPDPSELANLGLLSRTVEVDRLGPQYETCNIFYPHELLESLGGFNEEFGLRPTGEDTDLAWRAIESGRATVFAPDAVVLHAVQRLGIRGMLSVATRWTAGMRVFADHPQVRSTLYRDTFWNVWHYLVWRSALCLLGPAWLRRMLLTMHLMQLRARARRAGSGVWAVPFLIVYDLVECWAIARGAVRYRTLVL